MRDPIVPIPAAGTDRRFSRRLAAGAAPLLAGLLLATTLTWAGPAHADDGPGLEPPPGSGQIYEGWALAPTGSDPSQPSSRANLTAAVGPGGTQQDSVTLWNYSDVPLTFHVYATDAFNNATGEFTLLRGDQKPKDVGSWVTLATNQVTVGAKERVDIPFTLHVPATASPGDHTAGIVASLPTPTTDGKQRVIVDRRTGSRLYVRVNGPVDASLVVEDLSSTYHGAFSPLDGSLDVTYTVRNAGNVRLGARQRVEATSLFGTVADARPQTIPELLPGNAVTVHQQFTGVPATFRVGADVTVEPIAPAGVADTLPAKETVSTNAWAIPWTLLLVLALALLLWRLYRRFRSEAPESVLRYDSGRPGATAPG